MLAGLGTLGKSTLLLNETYGNRLVLGAVLTDANLPSDPPAVGICRENCRLCVENCPAGALDGTTVSQFLCRKNTYITNARGFPYRPVQPMPGRLPPAGREKRQTLKPTGAEERAAARPLRRRKQLLGWSGVAVTVLLSGFWAYWGAFENFHEGWYAETLLKTS